MSAPTFTLALRGGRWFVRDTMPAYSAPELVSNYWPVSMDSSTFDPGDKAADGAALMAGSRPDTPFMFAQHGFRRYVFLRNGGKTECVPEMTERAPIPPPAQRGRKLAVRWEGARGCWQKLTAKGWRDA